MTYLFYKFVLFSSIPQLFPQRYPASNPAYNFYFNWFNLAANPQLDPNICIMDWQTVIWTYLAEQRSSKRNR